MVKKAKTRYSCSNCGEVYASWSGKCQSCGEWNTLFEMSDIDPKNSKGTTLKPIKVSEAVQESAAHTRITSGNTEIDQLLGGGIVDGAVILLAGQPGIGKSTLLLQIAAQIASNVSVLYVSGEESSQQVGLRAKRLGFGAVELHISSTNSAEDIAATISRGDYRLVVVDSIQTIAINDIASASGSVSQISASAQLLISAAKKSHTAVIIVGHVTKEGSIAGPKVLEHLVDVVLQFEGDRYDGFKILRTQKNRYGPTTEVAILEMKESGLESVINPSASLLEERQVTDGSIVACVLEGTRPVLVEIQALVTPTKFGYPKRTASGFDINRLNVLIAVLERRTNVKLQDKDIFINVVGGIKITEPSADLAVAMAIASADRGMKLKEDAVVCGELGLSGEVRHVQFLDKRVKEAIKLGFSYVIGPKQKGKNVEGHRSVPDVRSALNTYLEK